MKKCNRCKETKPMSEFHNSNTGRLKDGKRPYCKTCAKNGPYKKRLENSSKCQPKGDKKKIKEITKTVRELNKYYGPHTVSKGHIVPLKGEINGEHVVSGLNVSWNIEIECASSNYGKAGRVTKEYLQERGRA